MGLLARILTILLIPGAAYAGSLGDVADNLMEPTTLITKLVLITCYIVGLALLLMALAQYKLHRQSPKLVPLSTPITLAVLGIISLLIPYGTNLFGPSFSAEEQNPQTQEKTILPLPDVNSNKGSLVPLPSDTPPASEPEQSQPTRPSKPAPKAAVIGQTILVSIRP